MNWDNLKYFLAVAREGQFLAAARRSKVGQATLNRRITALEEELGAKLFERSTNGCALTALGQDLMAHAERVEAEALHFQRARSRRDGQVEGVLRIGAPDGFGVAFLAGKLGRLKQRHPNLVVQLVPVPRAFSLAQREADIAVTVSRPARGRLLMKKLTDYRLGLYAARSYLQRHRTPQSVEALPEHPYIGYVEDLIYAPELDFSRELPVRWDQAIEVSGALGQFEAVRSGAGIGILHCFMADPETSLQRILPAVEITRSYWTVWHESLRDSARIRAAVDFLDDVVAEARTAF
jgi:DNA-binding transcriptional LysR family regulator